MGRVGDWLSRKVREPLVRELRQGATPEGLASSVATGAALGILPFLGMVIITMVLFYTFPAIGLWLPQAIYGR